ncbi:MAG: CAP domain-containing protein [Thermoflexales bacterium]|nr:CAP domain-containing protein [Thermoflexales bacterium]
MFFLAVSSDYVVATAQEHGTSQTTQTTQTTQQTQPTPQPTPLPKRRARRTLQPRPTPQPVCTVISRELAESLFARINAWRAAQSLPPMAWDEQAYTLAAATAQFAIDTRSLADDVLNYPEGAHSYQRQLLVWGASVEQFDPEWICSKDYILHAQRGAISAITCRRNSTFRFSETETSPYVRSAWFIYTTDLPPGVERRPCSR